MWRKMYSVGGAPLAMLDLKTILKCEKDVRFVYTRIFNSQKKFMVYWVSMLCCHIMDFWLYLCIKKRCMRRTATLVGAPSGILVWRLVWRQTRHDVHYTAYYQRLMDKLLLILSSLLMLTSCAEQYNIAGNSNIACLDGRMLYLRVSSSADEPVHRNVTQIVSVCLDSCKVVHGRFNFEGDVDSARMAML